MNSFTDNNSIYNGGFAISGGAIYCTSCQTMTLTNVTFINNFAMNGGAIAFINYPENGFFLV